ncbi:MAG: hypothetical protein P1Q69_16750 [Candidatus Thorarchaeota archaeon]|nr:hypothetical protein [Candidatus Thorarchaeota archaeon]
MSQKAKSNKLAYIDSICDSCERGDIDGVRDLLKGYYNDKTQHPWHKIHSLIQKNWEKSRKMEKLPETLTLIRDGVFGALDISSLSLALDEPVTEILAVLLKAKTWVQGRKDVRAYCSMKAAQFIANQSLDFLDPSSLSHDGFGYLIPLLNESRLEQYRKAQPKEDGKILDVKSLARSVYGRKILRNLGITKSSLEKKDPLAEQLLQEYDNFLIELECDTSRTIESIGPTEQLTLNGKPLTEEEEEQEKKKPSEKATDGVQAPLSEYMEPPKKKPTPKQASRKRSQGRRKKKEGKK